MAISADILLSDITNVDETGIFDVLMKAVNKHVNQQYQEGRITGSEYSSVYLGGIQTVLQQAVQYNLQEKLNEAQIANAGKDNELKDQELLLKESEIAIKEQELAIMKNQNALERAKTIASIDKEYGFDYTIDGTTGEILIGADNGDGKVDAEVDSIKKDTDTKERQILEQELTGSKQRIILDAELKIIEQKIVGKAQSSVIKE